MGAQTVTEGLHIVASAEGAKPLIPTRGSGERRKLPQWAFELKFGLLRLHI